MQAFSPNLVSIGPLTGGCSQPVMRPGSRAFARIVACYLSAQRGDQLSHSVEKMRGGQVHICASPARSASVSPYIRILFSVIKRLKGKQLPPQCVPKITSECRPELQSVLGVSSETESSCAVSCLLLSITQVWRSAPVKVIQLGFCCVAQK